MENREKIREFEQDIAASASTLLGRQVWRLYAEQTSSSELGYVYRIVAAPREIESVRIVKAGIFVVAGHSEYLMRNGELVQVVGELAGRPCKAALDLEDLKQEALALEAAVRTTYKHVVRVDIDPQLSQPAAPVEDPGPGPNERLRKQVAFLAGMLQKAVVHGDHLDENEAQQLDNLCGELGFYELDEREFRY